MVLTGSATSLSLIGLIRTVRLGGGANDFFLKIFMLQNCLRGLLPKNLQNVAKGGTAPRLVVLTMTICGPYAPSLQLLYPPRPHI